MPSIADTRMAQFIARGFTTGSLADRSMALLIVKGALVGSLADRQVALGKVVNPDGYINPDDYP